MIGALILSIIVKGLGAVFEIANQIFITRFGGVALFGEYNFYVSVTEILCWLFFSGIVKTNAYYVANGIDISKFRIRFFLLFALPLSVLLSAASTVYSILMLVVVATAFLYGMQMNLSSFFLACGKYKVSLFGEYLVSRVVIFIGVTALIWSDRLNESTLVFVYSLGFLISIIYFVAFRKGLKVELREASSDVSADLVRKQIKFQFIDVANGLINYAPVLVQYLFGGAFQAGVLSVVLVTRKVINFIAGPTAKVYLPEFARRHGNGDIKGLRAVYREIVLLQMCFILPIFLIVVSAPESILMIYNDDLVDYHSYMRLAAFIFLIMVLFGPQGNLLSMAGREGVEMWTKWVSLASMILAMLVSFGSDYFVLIGIGAQVIVDSFIKLYFLIKVLHGFPISIVDWLKMLLPTALFAVIVCSIPLDLLNKLIVACVLAVILMFLEFGLLLGETAITFLRNKTKA